MTGETDPLTAVPVAMPMAMERRHIDAISREAEAFGLLMRGGLRVDAGDSVPEVGVRPAQSLLLFGNAGSSIWTSFSASPEYSDGQADPLNRWSERIGSVLAAEWNGLALFPFGGPPYQPFLNWAKKAEMLQSSQLGLLMHPRYGLWHAYRFAVALAYVPEGLEAAVADKYACDDCTAKPCLGGCPVNAFSSNGYDVEACFRYLQTSPQAACHRQGCQARAACPEGEGYRYTTEQAAFHMKKFMDSLSDRFASRA